MLVSKSKYYIHIRVQQLKKTHIDWLSVIFPIKLDFLCK